MLHSLYESVENSDLLNTSAVLASRPSDHASLGKVYAAQGKWSEAGREFGLAAALVEKISADNQSLQREAAIYRYAEGVAWFNVPQCQPLAKMALGAAFKYFNKAQDNGRAADVSFILENINEEITYSKSVVTLPDPFQLLHDIFSTGQQQNSLYRTRTRAFFHTLIGNSQEAKNDLLDAFLHAKELGLIADLTQIEQELSLLPSKSYPSPKLTLSLLQAIQLHFKSQKYPQTDRNLYLEQALRYLSEKDYDEVVYRAAAAQMEALQLPIPQRYFDYLTASLLLAMGYDALGEDVLVLDALIACKRRLEHEIGLPAGELLKRITQHVISRWEPGRFQRAMSNYEGLQKIEIKT